MRYRTEKTHYGKIFYFLKPDIHGNLILHNTVNVVPIVKYYISEEQFGDEGLPISLLKRHGGELYGNKSRNSMRIQWMDSYDRLHNLGALVVKLLGYDMTTKPTAAEILRNTRLQHEIEVKRENVLSSSEDMDYVYSLDNISVLGNYYMRKRKSLRLKSKRKVCSCKKRK
jgi:hypothetical protein